MNFDMKVLEKYVASMVAAYGANPATGTAKIISTINGIFFLIASAGFSYDANLPVSVSAFIVILVTLVAFLVPLFQGHLTAAKVFSPTTVAGIIGALKNASDAGGAVIGGTKDSTVIVTDKVVTGGVPESKVIRI